MRLKSLILTIMLIAAISGCKKDKGVDIDVVEFNDLVITLDKGVYAPEAAAHLTIKNRTDMDLILLNCGTNPGFDLQKLIVGKWNNVYLIDCPAIGVPFEIPAGGSFDHDISLPPINLSSNQIEGKYRLLLWLKDKKTGEFLNKNDRATDPFEIKLPQN